MSRFFLIAIGAVVLLTACAGPKLYNYRLTGAYHFTELMAAHGGKDMTLEVMNNPYDISESDLIARMSAAMSGRNLGQPITFVETAVLAAEAPTRMVAAFHPPLGTLPNHVCEGAFTARGAPADGVVILAYCKNDTPLSSIWVGLPPQAANAEFAGAFDSVLLSMLPFTDPGARTNRRCAPNCA